MKKKTIFLAIIYFLFGIAMNLVHPITPGYTEWLQLSDFYYGLLFSMMSLGQVIGAVFFGRLSDKIGRLSLLVVGLFGYAFFQFCFGFWTQSEVLILLFRLGSGFFSAAPHVLFLTFVPDLEKEEKPRARAFFLFTALYLLGSSLGYKIGGLLFVHTTLSYFGVFLVQVIMVSSLAVLLAFSMRKENRVQVEGKKTPAPIGFRTFKKLGWKPCAFFLLLFLVATAQIMTTKFVEKYLYFLSYNEDDLGNMMMVTGLLGLLINLIWSLVLQKKGGHYPRMYVGTLVVSSIAIFLTFLFGNQGFMIRIYTIYAVFIMAKSLSAPLEATMIQKMSGENSRGLYLGLRQSFLSLGNFIGPMIGGLLYGAHHLSVFFVSSGLFLFIAFLFFLLFGREKEIITKENQKEDC